MARGKLWGYVASGARALGALGGALGGPGGSDRTDGGAAPEGRGPFRPFAMASPRSLSRAELERLRWTGRQAGCDPQARHVQVAEVVRRVVRGGGRAAAVTVRLAPGLPVVTGDARRMEAALAGLVDHAIRRSPLGGGVLVRAEVVGTGRAAPRSAARAGCTAYERERVELRISDRGSYEPPAGIDRLSTGVRATGPVGPALHSLVLAAGGRLSVEPTPGGGLTVVLLLTVAYD
ncbi:hypothetical protein ABT247_02990 [Kitasatospora sp. NPDC001539]|uniref:hypothetical protein n=1 Tax=Kitasatospora sp. NPDC001539 TaxID=3154384 RepID=UPI00331F21C2